MYAITAPRCIMNYELQNLVQKYALNWEEFMKLFPSIYLHSGRTDGNGGHHDWLNRTGWGIGSYHYHHKLPAHLHPNGKCPYGNTKACTIFNPYTGKEVNIGIPYVFEGASYFSLNLVGKSLTANDELGIKLDNNSGGVFFACSSGDSSKEKLGEEFSFTYPKDFLGLKDNKLFETNDGKLQLLAASDGSSTSAYISLETVRGYMTKDGYFTDFTDNGSSVWSFIVRKPIVHIISPQNGDAFNIGDEITVQANIEHVASARLIVGKRYPMGYIDGFEERRYNLENQPTVVFSKFKLTENDIGSTAIESGSLDIGVSGHTGGTAIEAEIDARTLGDSVIIRIENSQGLSKGREIFIPHTVNGILNGVSMTLSPVDKWGAPGKGSYPQGVQKDSNGCYIVAVGPKIIDPNYPDNGKIWPEDFDSFSKRIDVVLEHKTTGEIKTIECVVGDFKAHSYNKYLDGHAYNTGDTASFNVENGLLQTGIAYPKSWNAGQSLACSPGHMNGTVIEFCGHQVDFDYENYKLVKLIVLDE